MSKSSQAKQPVCRHSQPFCWQPGFGELLVCTFLRKGSLKSTSTGRAAQNCTATALSICLRIFGFELNAKLRCYRKTYYSPGLNGTSSSRLQAAESQDCFPTQSGTLISRAQQRVLDIQSLILQPVCPITGGAGGKHRPLPWIQSTSLEEKKKLHQI